MGIDSRASTQRLMLTLYHMTCAKTLHILKRVSALGKFLHQNSSIHGWNSMQKNGTEKWHHCVCTCCMYSTLYPSPSAGKWFRQFSEKCKIDLSCAGVSDVMKISHVHCQFSSCHQTTSMSTSISSSTTTQQLPWNQIMILIPFLMKTKTWMIFCQELS